MGNYIVFDIGGSSIKWGVLSKKGDFLKKGRLKVSSNVEEFFKLLVDTINDNKEEFKIEGVGISAPGAVDKVSGVIGGASAIPYIHGPNFKKIIKEGTGLSVAIENDANCAALGESFMGAAKGCKDAAFVVCGSGIGGAIIKNGEIHSGVNKHGGEFGYTIVDYDKEGEEKYLTWSRAGSTTALARAIAKRKGIKEGEIDGIKAFALYEEGDEIAKEEVNNYFRYMAIGIYNIQYTYDPEIIVLGGAISERENYLAMVEEKIEEIMKNNRDGKIKPKVKVCEKGNDANIYGALREISK